MTDSPGTILPGPTLERGVLTLLSAVSNAADNVTPIVTGKHRGNRQLFDNSRAECEGCIPGQGLWNMTCPKHFPEAYSTDAATHRAVSA